MRTWHLFLAVFLSWVTWKIISNVPPELGIPNCESELDFVDVPETNVDGVGYETVEACHEARKVGKIGISIVHHSPFYYTYSLLGIYNISTGIFTRTIPAIS